MVRSRLLAGLTVALAVTLGAPGAASAETARGRDVAKPLGGSPSLHEMFGVPVAKRLLASDKTDDRIRGVERLGALGTDEAITALVEALEGGGSTAADTMVRLSAVRVLAAHTDKEGARQSLVRELSAPVGPEARGTVSPLQSLLRRTAALALARAGTKKNTAPLLAAVERGGPAAEAASHALRAYPPVSIDSFFENRKKLPASQIAFLGDLGDLRAIEKLRPMLSEEDVDVKLAAVIALAKLGDETAAITVRPWLKRGDPRLLKAAAEVLIQLGAPEAAPSVAALLASDVTREAGLALALRAPMRALVPALSAALEKLSPDDQPRAIAAIGRAGGPEAVQKLVLEIENGAFGPGESDKKSDAKSDKKSDAKSDKKSDAKRDKKSDAKRAGPKDALVVPALFALATMPGDEARAALEKLLGDARASKEDAIGRSVVRAAIVRAIVRRDAPAALSSRLSAWFASKDGASRAVAALGLVATGAKPSAEIIEGCTEKKCDEPIVMAAARGALARGSADLSPFLKLLESAWARGADLSRPKPLAIAAGVGLLTEPNGGALPTSTLAAWAEGGGPLAPLAARALPSRDDDVTRGRIERLLKGSDPVVRAGVAMGLGKDPEKDAVSLLVAAYRFEDDVQVRASIIRALSERAETQRTATLETARALDPDDGIRALARAALAGRTLPPALTLSQAAAWVAIEDNDSTAQTGAKTPRQGRVVRSDGVAVPFVVDPDGVLVMPGLSYQKFNLQLVANE